MFMSAAAPDYEHIGITPCVEPPYGIGYLTRIALNAENEIIGYEFINLGKMMDFIKKGDEPAAAMEKAKGHYGQFDNAVKYVDPRQE